jgi:hypothetical protein
MFGEIDSTGEDRVVSVQLLNPLHAHINFGPSSWLLQAKMLDLLRSDPKTSEEEHFKLMLVQTEVERVKFLIRSYVRCRMAKVSRRPGEELFFWIPRY